MPSERFQTRVPDELAEKIHDYIGDQHMNESEAIRHLIRSGLRAEGAWDDSDDETDDELGTTVASNTLANYALGLAVTLFVVLVSVFASQPVLRVTTINLAGTGIMAFLGAAFGVEVANR